MKRICRITKLTCTVVLLSSGLFHDRFPYVSHQFEIPLFRSLTILSLIFLTTGSIVNLCVLLKNGDIIQMINNGFMLVLCSFASHAVALALWSKTLMPYSKLIDIKKKLWTIKEAGPELRRKIEDDIRFQQSLRIVMTVLCILSSIFLLPISGDIRELFGILYLFDDFYSKSWYMYLLVPLKCIQMFISFCFPSPCFMVFYWMGDCYYGIRILREKLQLIEKTFGTKEIWVYDHGYQKYVEIMLKRCLEQHVLVKEYYSCISRLVADTLLVAYLSMVGLIALFYFNFMMNFSMNLLVKGSFMSVLIFGFVYCYTDVGQTLQDECEDFYRDLCECPWYLWNKSNKKLYLMFLIHAKDPLMFHGVDICVNYTMIVRMTRTTLSMLTAFRRLTDI